MICQHLRALPFCAAMVMTLVGLSPAMAGAQAELRARIEASGTHSFDDTRHSVKVEGCQLTTERWRDRPDHGWVLWSSFQFDMINAVLPTNSSDPGKSFLSVPINSDVPDERLVMIVFNMRDGTSARFEKSVLRPPKGDTKPSPRNDGTTHYFQDSVSFFFRMEGTDVDEKARNFVTAYQHYVSEYCMLAS